MTVSKDTPGARFRSLANTAKPLQILGTVNPYCALMAVQAGARSLYLSGSGVATASYGLPDLGITSLADVLADARRITSVCETPLLVDIDTGWGSAFTIARSVREMIGAGVAAVHLEDQVCAKRCGHRPGKAVVSSVEMVDRIKAAVDARTDPGFVIMARTDALAVEGIESAIRRAMACVEAGADMIFPEALSSLDEYRRFVEAVRVPVLANMTEFGKTPLFGCDELAGVGVAMVLYPLSAHRAMAKAALNVYQAILRDGHQGAVLDLMQTRDELYANLNYHHYEQTLDRLFGADKENKR